MTRSLIEEDQDTRRENVKRGCLNKWARAVKTHAGFPFPSSKILSTLI